MTGFIIVPDALDHAIKRDLEALRDTLPETERSVFETEYPIHRQAILDHFAQYGTYPQIGGVEKSNASR